MDCLNELRFTRQSRLESVLEVENDVMLVQVFPHLINISQFKLLSMHGKPVNVDNHTSSFAVLRICVASFTGTSRVGICTTILYRFIPCLIRHHLEVSNTASFQRTQCVPSGTFINFCCVEFGLNILYLLFVSLTLSSVDVSTNMQLCQSPFLLCLPEPSLSKR